MASEEIQSLINEIAYFKTPKQRGCEWAIAYQWREWMRTLKARGWTDARRVYIRAMTSREIEDCSKAKRYIGGRYRTLEKLLSDEREILLPDHPEEYERLKATLEKEEGRKIIETEEQPSSQYELWSEDETEFVQIEPMAIG